MFVSIKLVYSNQTTIVSISIKLNYLFQHSSILDYLLKLNDKSWYVYHLRKNLYFVNGLKYHRVFYVSYFMRSKYLGIGLEEVLNTSMSYRWIFKVWLFRLCEFCVFRILEKDTQYSSSRNVSMHFVLEFEQSYCLETLLWCHKIMVMGWTVVVFPQAVNYTRNGNIVDRNDIVTVIFDVRIVNLKFIGRYVIIGLDII